MEKHAPWIRCRTGMTQILLARDEKAYYIIEVGKKLDYATEEWLESQGVSEELLKELQLPFTYIPRKMIQSIDFTGQKAGDRLHIKLKKDKKVVSLGENLTDDRIREFFDGILRTRIPKENIVNRRNANWRREKRDPVLYKKLWWVSVALGAVSAFSLIGFHQTKSPFWFTLCLVMMGAPVALDILMPGYFTIFFSEKNKKPDAWSLEIPLAISYFGMVFCGRLNTFDDGAFLKIAGLCALGAMLICLLAEEFRRKPIWVLMPLALGAMCVSFAVCHANVVYAPEEPQSYVLAVEDTRISSGKNTSYYCTVTLPDGREMELSISRTLYRELEVGDYVRVDHGVGALGLEYASAHPYEEGE